MFTRQQHSQRFRPLPFIDMAKSYQCKQWTIFAAVTLTVVNHVPVFFIFSATFPVGLSETQVPLSADFSPFSWFPPLSPPRMAASGLRWRFSATDSFHWRTFDGLFRSSRPRCGRLPVRPVWWSVIGRLAKEKVTSVWTGHPLNGDARTRNLSHT